MIYNLTTLLLLAILSAPGLAEEDQLETSQAHSVGRIVADQSGLKPGGTLLLGIHIQLEPEWHTYWKNPGDSASTAIFDYSLPAGYQSSPLHFGVPQRIPVGPLMSFGYETETVLYSQIQVPETESAHLGQTRKLKISAEWVVCKVECLPAFFDFQLTLPVQANPEPSEQAQLFAATAKGMQAEQWFSAQLNPSDQDQVTVDIDVNASLGQLTDLIPYPKQMVTNDRVKIVQSSPDQYRATFKLNSTDQVSRTHLKLLALYDQDNKEPVAVSISAKPESEGLFGMLLFAFLGGLILNLMPCVFPVLALKLFSFVKVGPGERQQLVVSNLFYLLGVVVSFWILAGCLILFRSSGSALGWGFQMQSPVFVAGMILLFFTLGLNFIGLFEFSGRFAGTGHKLTTQGGLRGSFFTGVLAVIVASPCTAPFMGAAMGYALSQSPVVTIAIFTALGFGLAFPYLFFSLFPGLARVLPKPGMWMVRFKELMAFPMWATGIWLTYVLVQLTTPLAVATILLLCLSTAGILWGWRTFQTATGRFTMTLLFLGSCIGPIAALGTGFDPHPTESSSQKDSFWTPFDEAELESLIASGRPVFINFTAAWCISCQVNDRTTFQSSTVREFVAANNVVMMKGDWTNRNERIGKFLARYGRAGVPLYLYFSPSKQQATVLPEILTPSEFINRLKSH